MNRAIGSYIIKLGKALYHANLPESTTKTSLIIFSLKAGAKTFSNAQFPIEEAIEITSQAIKQLNQKSPGHYHFIIDGMTSPYIPEGQKDPEDEPEQRKRFRESEEHWFGKLREELPGIELTFINGMNLVEKYPYYKKASKFIRFGTGSYQMVWQTLKESTPSNQLAVLVKNSEDERFQLKNRNYATLLPHQNSQDSANRVIDFIAGDSNPNH